MQIIALCEAWAEDLHKSDDKRPKPAEVYDHMRIEAAVSHFHGLDRTMIESFSTEERERLMSWTGQRSLHVFYDMADGNTVTNKLARWTLNFVKTQVPTAKVGQINVAYRKQLPSKREFIDVKQRNLPEEARAALTSSQLALWPSDKNPKAGATTGVVR